MDQPKPPEQPKPWDKPKPLSNRNRRINQNRQCNLTEWINQNLNVLTKAPGVIPRGFGKEIRTCQPSPQVESKNKPDEKHEVYHQVFRSHKSGYPDL